ncbi:MAG: cadherin domain-containing protein, partial [Betaproteobacteria bacterium]|nr:cadherin domain-containing protein [Betaproteobacteria bacterium]
PGDVLLTITLSTPAPFPQWTGSDSDSIIEVVASPTNPQTEGLVRVAAGKNLDFDHESLSDGEVSVRIGVAALNGTGANLKSSPRAFFLVADPRNDETPVLPQPDDQGPYPSAGGSDASFVIAAATDADRGSGGDIAGYRASLIVSGSAEALPSWITFTSATRTFAVAAAGRSAGTHVIEVEAYDNGTNPGVLTARQRFNLVVTFTGQPHFIGSDSSFNLDENAAAGTVVGTLTAMDADDTDSTDAYPAYALSSAADGLFVIDAASGVISTAPGSSFDYESGTTSYTFAATATDTDGNVGRLPAVVVAIDNVDEAPEFATSSQNFDVAENLAGETTAAGTAVATVTATDEDAGAVIAYSLTGTDAGVFDIDAATGVISLKAAERFVLGASYSFNVVATSAGKSDTLAVVINVTGGTPNFTASTYTFSLEENSPAGHVLATVTANDGDDTDPTDAWPQYALSGAPGLFVIDAATGEITTSGSAGDFETGTTSWSFKVTAVDAEGNSGEADVMVALTNVDEPPQFSAARITVEVDANEPGETTAAGTALVTLTAVDPDAGSAAVSYSLTGTDAAVSVIDAATGVISSAREMELQRASYLLTVTASSGLSGSIEVLIEVGLNTEVQAAQDMVVFGSVDRAIAVAAIDIIGARFGAPAAVGGLPQQAGEPSLLQAPEQL